VRAWLLLVLLTVSLLAGCGGEESARESTPTPGPPSAEANEAYERAFSECASTPPDLLAGKYKAVRTREAIAKAVGAAWADQLGGGAEAARAGEAGCRDALEARPSPSGTN
jgi:hypothetical protein